MLVFAIKRLALISIHFCPSFFLLQLNLTYMKGILHLVPVKIIILKSSNNSPAADCQLLVHSATLNYMYII